MPRLSSYIRPWFVRGGATNQNPSIFSVGYTSGVNDVYHVSSRVVLTAQDE